MNNENQINITWGSLWKIFALILIGFIFFKSVSIILAVFLALIISSAFGPFVSFLVRYKIPRALGTTLLFLILISGVGSLIYIITPLLYNDLNLIIERAHSYLEVNFDVISKILGVDSSALSDIYTISLEKIGNFIPSLKGEGSLIEFTGSILENIILFLTVFVISFYLLIDPEGVPRFLKDILPSRVEDKVLRVYARASKKMGHYLQSQLLISLIIGLFVFLGLYILGVKHAFLIGIVAALFEIVPFVGPIITGTIAVLIALSQSTDLALFVLIYFIGIQWMENHLLIPLLLKRTLGLHPIAAVIALLLGGNLFGFMGIILAIPATIFLQEFLEDWSSRKASVRAQELL
mgnify:CR=1 FL=1